MYSINSIFFSFVQISVVATLFGLGFFGWAFLGEGFWLSFCAETE